MKKFNIIILTILVFLSSFSVGLASWTFSGDSEVEEDVAITISEFHFSPDFTGIECLDKRTLDINDQFLHALNTMDNIYDRHGQALVRALLFSANDEYVGNKDKHHFIYINLDIMMDVPEGCTFAIVRDEDNNFGLYITYKNLHNYSYGSRVSAYEIRYELYDGEYYPVSAKHGTCEVHAYDMDDMQIQRSISPKTFK